LSNNQPTQQNAGFYNSNHGQQYQAANNNNYNTRKQTLTAQKPFNSAVVEATTVEIGNPQHHQNYKLFEGSKCGIVGVASRIAYGMKVLLQMSFPCGYYV